MSNQLRRLPILCWQAVYMGLSRLGEALGWDWLTYNWGVTLSFHRTAKRNAPLLADAVQQSFPHIKSVVDIGCGTGDYLAEFQRRGLKVLGCEYGERPRRWAAARGVRTLPFDLSKESQTLPDAPYDLVMSLEVAEHVPVPLADEMVRFVTSHGSLVVFTAAPPGQGGQGHVNEQPKSYWIAKFQSLGFIHDQAAADQLAAQLRAAGSADFLYNNMMVFRRA